MNEEEIKQSWEERLTAIRKVCKVIMIACIVALIGLLISVYNLSGFQGLYNLVLTVVGAMLFASLCTILIGFGVYLLLYLLREI